MFHIERGTPEWRRARLKGLPRTRITERDLAEIEREFTTGEDADIIGLGSPQLSSEELVEISRLMEKNRPRIPVWVFTSRPVRDEARRAVDTIESFGGKVFVDTCLEVTMIENVSKTVATPSGKGAVYLPTLCGQKVVLGDVARLFRRYAA